MNINNNNRKNYIKAEDIEIDNVDHAHVGEDYKNLIDNVFKFRLRMEICVSQNLIIENLV